MTSERIQVVLLRDAAGSYYLLTPEALDQYKLSPERQAALEQALSGGDVTGFITPITIPIPPVVEIQGPPSGLVPDWWPPSLRPPIH